MTSKTAGIYGEFLRRYVCFHEGEDMYSIRLWGLFNWGDVSNLIKKGDIKTSYTKENKTIWCNPSDEIIDNIIYPAYLEYKNDTGRHVEDKFEFDSYDKYIYKVI